MPNLDLEAIRARNEERKEPTPTPSCGSPDCEDGFHMVPDEYSMPCPNRKPIEVPAVADIDALIAEVERLQKLTGYTPSQYGNGGTTCNNCGEYR